MYFLIPMLFMSSIFGSNYLDVKKQIESETAKSLESTYKMQVCGTGGGAMYGVDSVMLAFDIKRPVTIEEARAIAVGSAELYLKNINKNKMIRPYLEEYPFTARGVELFFYVHSPNRNGEKKPIDSFVLSCGGNIKVPRIRYDVNDENNRLVEVFRETYDEARERLNGIRK